MKDEEETGEIWLKQSISMYPSEVVNYITSFMRKKLFHPPHVSDSHESYMCHYFDTLTLI